ncbi:transglutaminase-like domain-containing protein [Clostridium massiliodielmoense]|uniref:transglutaminase-like domain-containing protein n=1 Tax=Clostridium massiliodielmoense TaxID=1776385 RepID=UPI0004D5B5C6|nr:transglutaminase-like domain-containing protein [Clostridium massiliodielmoense]KEH98720.1 transglutaminase [Clostridium botulinum C/D str. BKT12695]
MNKKPLKVLSVGAILGSIMQISMPLSAEAAIDSYIIKVSKEIYSYNKVELVDNFLEYKLGNTAELYSDFTIKLKMANGFYAFHDKKKGYIKYEDVENKYLKSRTSNNRFNVESYIESRETKIIEVNWTKKAILTVEGNIKYITRENNINGTSTIADENFINNKEKLNDKDDNNVGIKDEKLDDISTKKVGEKQKDNNEKTTTINKDSSKKDISANTSSVGKTSSRRHKSSSKGLVQNVEKQQQEVERQAQLKKEQEEKQKQAEAEKQSEREEKERQAKLAEEARVKAEEKLKAEQAEKERLAKIEADKKLEAERIEKENQAKLQKEAEERAEAEKLKQQQEAERQAQLKKEQEEKQKQAEAEKQSEREEKERQAKLAEEARVKAEEKLKVEQAEKQRLAKIEADKKLEAERIEKENQAKLQKEAEERAKAEKLKQQQEAERQAQLKKEQAEKEEKAKQAKLAEEKLKAEQAEKERLAKIEEEKQRVKDENNKLIEEAKNNINLGDLTNVKDNLTLPTEDSSGVKISWKSNDEATIKNDGTVTRPSSDSQDKNVKLVATFTKDEQISTKEFEAIVKAQEKPKVKTRTEEIVDLLKEDKPIEFKKPENFDIAVKEAVKQLKEKFEMIVPYSEYTKYNFNKYNNIMVELGGEDYGKPGVSTSSGTVIAGKAKMTVKFNYRRDVDEVKRQKKATEEAVNRIIGEVIKPGMTDVQKELALHDYVVKHAEYNMAGLTKQPGDLEDHSAYGVLVLGKGVCESYAKAMHLLLNEVGVECKYATGYKRNPDGSKGGGHAWNMVKLDNDWYNLDATWDDPVSDRVGRSDKEVVVSPVSHAYFNVTDAVFNKDHIRGEFEQNNYPTANGTKYSYDNLDVDEFMNDGTKVPKVTSRDELIQEVKEAMQNRKTELYVRLKGFKMTMQELMTMLGQNLDGNIYKSYGVSPTDSSHAHCTFTLR